MLADLTTSEIVVALVSAAIGGALVALINARSQRNQHLREQMIAAADGFLVASATSAVRLRDLMTSGEPLTAREADEALGEVFVLVPRVQLLFHPNSLTAREAEDAAKALQRVRQSVSRTGAGSSQDPADAMTEAQRALDAVARAAWSAISRPRRRWWRRALTTRDRLAYLDAQVSLYRELARARAEDKNAG